MLNKAFSTVMCVAVGAILAVAFLNGIIKSEIEYQECGGVYCATNERPLGYSDK